MTQPKDPQEPRQFWIDDILNVDRPSQKIAYIHEQDTEKCHRAIHVIEYSAYQSIQSKLEKAEAENKRLREALQKAVSAGEFFCRHADCRKDTWACKCEFCRDKESSKNLREARQALEGEGE